MNGAWRVVAAASSGVLLTWSFPPYAISALAWVALVPLWVAVTTVPARRALGLGWLCGTVMQLGTLGWAFRTLTTFGTLSSPIAAMAIGGAAVILGFPMGLFAAGVRVTAPGRHGLLAGVAWFVAAEWAGTWVPVRHVWGLLGASQVGCLPLAQTAEVGGVFILSALVALGNGAIATAVVAVPGERSNMLRRMALVAALELAIALAGAWRLRVVEATPPVGAVRIGMVQVAVDQRRKWRSGYRDELFEEYRELSHRVATERPDVILWPETALPIYLEDDPAGRSGVEGLARELRMPLVLGSPAVERAADDDLTYFNRAYLVDASGRIERVYDKRVLVPFGEYVPLGELIPFVRPLVTAPEDMTPGSTVGVVPIEGARLGLSLCYESAFADLARATVHEGATVLVNLSNDAWFGGPAGSSQALAWARLRAIEERRPLVRVASSGFSAVVAPSGRVEWLASPTTSSAHVATVGWPATRTVYGRFGDAVVWVSLVIVAASLWSRRGRGPLDLRAPRLAG